MFVLLLLFLPVRLIECCDGERNFLDWPFEAILDGCISTMLGRPMSTSYATPMARRCYYKL